MIVTLDEVQQAAKALPDPYVALRQRRFEWHVPIALPVLIAPIMDISPIGPEIRIMTFKLKEVMHYGAITWRWFLSDDLIM